jgi:YesN/AraC family two-component response regulator
MCLLNINLDENFIVRYMGHVNYTTPWKHFYRILNEYVIYIVKSGELYIKEGSTEYALRKDDLLILEPNIPHEGYKEGCCHYYYIHFSSFGISHADTKTDYDICEDLSNKRKISLTNDVLSSSSITDSTFYLPKHYSFTNDIEVFSFLQEADYDFYQKYENYKKIASLKFHELLIKLCRNYTNSRIQNNFSRTLNKLRDVINYLSTNYMNAISCKDIESLFETNYDYLNRLFKKVTGQTILNYLNQIRITRSKDLLCTTSLKFSEVGYLVGINDPYYFSKLFKKYTGMTASQYMSSRNSI